MPIKSDPPPGRLPVTSVQYDPSTNEVIIFTANKKITVGGGSSFQFPIGAVYLNITGVNPATELGYGTWSQIAQGQFLVGQKATDPDFDTAEETGGTKTHTLTIAEMPAHTHILRRHATATGALRGITTAPDTSSSNPQDAGPQSGSTGGGAAHNNLPPYLVCYIWRRDT